MSASLECEARETSRRDGPIAIERACDREREREGERERVNETAIERVIERQEFKA